MHGEGYIEHWWVPLMCLALAAFSLFTAFAIVRRWHGSWLYLTGFWIAYSVLVVSLDVLAGRDIHLQGWLYGLFMVVIMVWTTYSVKRLERGNEL
jgi:hypothetical protein